jgi:hypothetical protein
MGYMEDRTVSPSLQDFSLVRTYVQQFTNDFRLENDSTGFMFFALDLILGLQDDEAEDSITDTSYLKQSRKDSGHDRGIDALYIDENEKPALIHIFNFKYTSEEKKIGKNFPAGEIDKILSFVSALISGDEKIGESINKPLYGKVEEVWELFKAQIQNLLFTCAQTIILA